MDQHTPPPLPAARVGAPGAEIIYVLDWEIRVMNY